MSKAIGLIAGISEIAAGVLLEPVSGGLSTFLISAGVGMTLSGIGTLLSQGPVSGTSTSTRNPIAPWNVVYGRAKLGGTLVYFNASGENDKYLDLIFVLACHPSKSVDALLLDGQRVRLDQNGCSFVPTQQTVNIVSITRANDVVEATLEAGVTDLQTGDALIVQNVSGSLDSDKSFNGIFTVTVVDSTHITYICGGPATTLTGTGQVKTRWPNYKAKIHMEVLLGDHTATFPGMLNGTPYDGDPGNLVTVSNNPWTAEHLLLGRTSVFLRLHYNDEIFANGLPTIGFRISGKNDIFDPRSSAVSNTILQRPTTLLNGWGNNAHVGAYEEGTDQGYNFGLNNDTTRGYSSPDAATDGDLGSSAAVTIRHEHAYAGCVWQFAALAVSPADMSPPAELYLNILSAVNAYSYTGRSAGIWYSKDNGTNWTEVYNSPTHPQGWDSIHLPVDTDTSQLQVMAFTDAHDDMGHFVYDVQLATGPGTSNANGTGYTENAALCIADYLTNKTYGLKATYGADLPLDPLIAAANICDEAVTLAAGGTEPRYTCNGNFPLTLKRGEVIQNLLTSCGGRLTFSNGQFVIWPAAWVFNGNFVPDFPFPPPPNQNVAWAYASQWSPPGLFTIPKTIWNAEQGMSGASGASQTTGYVVLSGGDSLDTPNGLAIEWTDFVMPDIPADATVTALYPVMVVAGINSGGFIGIGGSVGSVAQPATGTHVGSIATSLGGISMNVTAFNSQPGAGGIGIDIGFVGVAVYYTAPGVPPPISAPPGTADMLAILSGPFRWRQKVMTRDLYNGVKGTYISPASNWEAADIPPYAQDIDHGYMSGGSPMYPFGDANLAADGGERRWLDIQLPFTISPATAQRLCKVELLRRRQQGTGTFAYNLAMYKHTALDIVTMTLPVLGWTNKVLEISNHRFTSTKVSNGETEVMLLGTEIDVQEADASVYAWDPREERTAEGFKYSDGGGVNNPISYATYTNIPAIALSIVDPTTIALAAVQTTFTVNGKVVNYNARTLTIDDPGDTATWVYVMVGDPDFDGDVAGKTLTAYAETTTDKVGVIGYIYMGAILMGRTSTGITRVVAGGWPAPSTFQVG